MATVLSTFFSPPLFYFIMEEQPVRSEGNAHFDLHISDALVEKTSCGEGKELPLQPRFPGTLVTQLLGKAWPTAPGGNSVVSLELY